MRRRAIFMDRDGTILDEVGYVNHVDRVRLLPRSAEAVLRVNDSGFQAVVVTNQAGVARGYFPESLVADVHDHLRALLGEGGGRLDGIYYCPHHPDAGADPYRKDCNCRKPRPGMLLRASEEMGIDLASSYVVGDTIKDIEAGHRVGATTILVLTGYGRGEIALHSSRWKLHPHHVAADLLEAVEWILGVETRGAAPAPVRSTESP